MRSSLARELLSCCRRRADRSARLVACWLERAEASLRGYARLPPIAEVRHLRVGLGQGCGEIVADPSEILPGQSDLTSEQAGILLC